MLMTTFGQVQDLLSYKLSLRRVAKYCRPLFLVVPLSRGSFAYLLLLVNHV